MAMTERVEASAIWKQAREKLTLAKHVGTDAEISHVLRHLENNASDIYSGYPVPRRNKQEIIQLAMDLSSNVPESSVQIRFNFLAIGFEIGNKEFGWNVPLIPQLVRVRKPKNWATIDNFTRRAVTNRLEQAFGNALEHPPANDLAAQLGQILFTAVFFGGLLERGWLEAFLNAVISREFFQYKGILWVEMVRKTKLSGEQYTEQDQPSYTKRFFPDNFTEVLLYRLLDLDLVPCAMPCPKPWDLLRSYLKSLPGISDLQLPCSLDEFLKLAISRNLFLPGSMLSFANGKLRSTSLAIEPWLRCISGKAVRNSRPEKPVNQHDQDDALMLIEPKKYSSKRQEALFGKLMEEISPKKNVELSRSATGKIFVKMLIDHKNELSPAFQLMIFWGKQLLTPRSSHLERRSKKEAVTVSTIRRYFRAIGSAFLLAAENQNLTKIDPAELELIYEQTIEDRQNDAKAPQCLYQFHGFLMAFYSLPPIESIELKGTSGASNLNANLITLEVYYLVLRGLGWGGMSRWKQLQAIAWSICYRCGLRPSEVLNLRTIDFQMVGTEDFELLVRVNPKSLRGRRRLPASLRMNSDECRVLLDYYQKRCSEIGLFGDDYLLAHPAQKTGRLADADIYEPIRKLLRLITKDDTLRLYHSRHTFNSGLQVQFQLRGEPLFNQADFLDIEVSTENDWLLRDALMGNEHWGRKDQHVQGILVGHSTPETTNLFYNHLNDALLGTLVRQRRDAVPVSLSAVAMLGGLKQSWAGELLAKSGREHPLASLVQVQARKHADELTHPLLAHAVPLSLPSGKRHEDAKLPSWETVLTEDLAIELQRGEENWDFTFQMYERVRRMKGKRFRSVVIIVQEMGSQLENNRRRWRGPTYAGITELKSVIATLLDIGVSTESIVLVHHPRRGQPVDEQAAALKLWRERVTLPTGGWIPGEPANATVPRRGLIELRVGKLGDRLTKMEKLPPVNQGFESAIRLLKNVIATVS